MHSIRTVRRLSCVLRPLVVALACGERGASGHLRLAAVTSRDIVVAASAAGVIEPVTTIEVKSKASGDIVEALVDEGDQVRPGQLPVRVDPRISLNAMVQAEADSSVACLDLC